MKIAVVLMLLCLGACGQTGPLYLPQSEAEIPAPQAEPEQPKTEQPKTSPAASPATTPQ
jgi:predicted small lipoprotein YifL